MNVPPKIPGLLSELAFSKVIAAMVVLTLAGVVGGPLLATGFIDRVEYEHNPGGDEYYEKAGPGQWNKVSANSRQRVRINDGVKNEWDKKGAVIREGETWIRLEPSRNDKLANFLAYGGHVIPVALAGIICLSLMVVLKARRKNLREGLLDPEKTVPKIIGMASYTGLTILTGAGLLAGLYTYAINDPPLDYSFLRYFSMTYGVMSVLAVVCLWKINLMLGVARAAVLISRQ